MAKRDSKTALELVQRARAEAFAAIERLWALAPNELQSVRVQITFKDGQTVGQRRVLRK